MKAVSRLLHNPGKVLGSVLAVGLLAALPLRARAEGIAFHNQLPVGIIVQGSSVVGNMLRNGAPFAVNSGRVGWDLRLPPGVRHISIYDANTRRQLHFERIPFNGQDIHLLVQPGPGGTLRLVPSKAPDQNNP
jgi:hypothetical protein